MACKFFEMLEKRWAAGARVCVGLDSDRNKIPEKFIRPHGAYPNVYGFNREVILATADLALCYKPNIAFYSGAFRAQAQEALARTIDCIHDLAPSVPVIIDAKRGDIGNTNAGYVDEAFVEFEADAVTVSPYFGMEAMKPFREQKDKGIIVLCRTSNPGAGEFQDLIVRTPIGEMPLYQYVAHRVANEWNTDGNCALVVGATVPNQLSEVRKIVGDMPILIPGIGTQGGDVLAAVLAGANSKRSGIIINSSSGIIFNKDPREATQKLTGQIYAALATGAL